jgi:hypothetical protein
MVEPFKCGSVQSSNSENLGRDGETKPLSTAWKIIEHKSTGDRCSVHPPSAPLYAQEANYPFSRSR